MVWWSPTVKLFLLLLRSSNFAATVMNCNVHGFGVRGISVLERGDYGFHQVCTWEEILSRDHGNHTHFGFTGQCQHFFPNCCGNLPGGDRNCCYFGCSLTLELSAVCSFCSLGFIHYVLHQCWIWLRSYWLPVFVFEIYNIILFWKEIFWTKSTEEYHRKPKGRGKGTLWIS